MEKKNKILIILRNEFVFERKRFYGSLSELSFIII